MQALQIEHLVKKYGEKTAVNDISFSVEEGEFFGFLGPNGAGKTTTIHMTTGIAKITSGSIKVLGKDVEKDYREARKLIGLSPQEFNIDVFAPIEKILWFVGGYYGMSRADRMKRIPELIKAFDLVEHKDMAFMKLSGGLKRRVMLARAMIHDPKVLILDEPTAGVDVELRHDLWRYLKEMNSNGKTIILTSHYLEEVEYLCERIGIIAKGNIVAMGKKEDFTGNGKKLEETYLSLTKRT